MRFAFALQAQMPVQRTAGTGLRAQVPVARIALRTAMPVLPVLPVSPVQQAAAPQSPAFDSLPDDLDQRVRLVGEW